MNGFHTQFDKYTKIWMGPKASHFFDADCSIGKILFAFMRNNPKNICQVRKNNTIHVCFCIILSCCQISDTEGTALNNAEAITFGIRLAQHFKSMGLRQDDVVGIIGSNTTYMMPLILGCLLNCTPFHAINHALDEGISFCILCIDLILFLS